MGCLKSSSGSKKISLELCLWISIELEHDSPESEIMSEKKGVTHTMNEEMLVVRTIPL